MAVAPTLRQPRAWNAWRKRRRFLSQFVQRGDLVYDIGANQGEYTVTFRQLGCNVVAVEPNPELAPGIPGVVEQAAVSNEPGEVTLLIGDRHREATIAGGTRRCFANAARSLERSACR